MQPLPLFESYVELERIVPAFLLRCGIAAQVVTGIGFLGAGCIIQSGNDVRGLTSAATIWVVASIGIVSGAGYPVLATIAANIVLITLVVLRSVEKILFKSGVADEYRGPNGDGSR